ncbi:MULTISPECIES: 4'-phosphopantetheinyl transferase family protein [Methylococcus]|uniref:4'-phosphopantetheinyl transferase superfamily protein n=1 Tax=Methylococcus capsulatus TaxID=414 RepID=A0ABZ2F516_METCP|nr:MULTISPECIES: 4'-phosphopantetheinyl transferase superfamily protein [Methylococcus]
MEPRSFPTLSVTESETAVPSLAALEAGQVHVWHGDLGSLSALAQNWLDEGETLRAARIGLAAARIQFVTGRRLLRGVLGHYLGRKPASLSFSIGPHGKPALRDEGIESELQFNLSHSGDVIVLALAWRSPVGIDVEARRPLARLDALARRCLAPSEQAQLDGLDDEAAACAFFRFWVRKEALGKASGQGMALGLQHCVSSLEGRPRWLGIPPQLGDVRGWSLAELSVREGFEGAVTVQAANARFFSGEIELEGENLEFENLKSLLYPTPDCVLGNAAADSSRYLSR